MSEILTTFGQPLDQLAHRPCVGWTCDASRVQPRLQRRAGVAAVEARGARDATCGQTTNDLLVLDGPLQGRSSYVPVDLNAVVTRLEVRERSPVFRVSSRYDTYTWYLRLPARGSSPWAGVVRVEATADLSTPAVIEPANLSQTVLPT